MFIGSAEGLTCAAIRKSCNRLPAFSVASRMPVWYDIASREVLAFTLVYSDFQ